MAVATPRRRSSRSVTRRVGIELDALAPGRFFEAGEGGELLVGDLPAGQGEDGGEVGLEAAVGTHGALGERPLPQLAHELPVEADARGEPGTAVAQPRPDGTHERLVEIEEDRRHGQTLKDDQPAAGGNRHRLGPTGRAELAAERGDVELGGVLADGQRAGDALVRHALGDELEHLELAGREWLGRAGGCRRWVERVGGDGQAEQDQAAVGGADGEVELGGVGVAAEAGPAAQADAGELQGDQVGRR